MTKKALIVRGGWEGHHPVEATELVMAHFAEQGWELDWREGTDVYDDPAALQACDTIVQCVTMSDVTDEQVKNLTEAVRAGTGFAGWHGGVIDSFRRQTQYQWMTGGQWVAHPGNEIAGYMVDIVDEEHEITRGLGAFELKNTEQYYVHFDPAVEVLCTTTFSGEHGETDLHGPVLMPYAWTRPWGQGRVFVACWGHTERDFAGPEALEIVRRGIAWTAGG